MAQIQPEVKAEAAPAPAVPAWRRSLRRLRASSRRWMRRLAPTRFQTQLLTVVFGAIAVLAVVSSTVIAHLTREMVKANLVEQGRTLTRTVAQNSGLAFLYESPENARSVVDNVLGFPGVVGVALYRTDGRPLLYAGEVQFQPAAWPREVRLVRETPGAWYFVAPAYGEPSSDPDSPFETQPVEPELLGYVAVVVSKGILDRMSRDMQRTNYAVVGLVAGILMLLLLIITRRMTVPVQELAATMHQAQDGARGLRARKAGPHEIREMVEAFNVMMEALEARDRALRNQNEELERRVARRTEELRRARDAALEASRTKSRFLANMSHELRTPLNAIIGYSELLCDDAREAGNEELLDDLEKIAGAGRHLLSLISNILDLSKIEAGKMEIQRQTFSVARLVHDTVGVSEALMQKNRNEFVVECPDNIGDMDSDELKIRQALLNLLSNAAKFTSDGRVTFRVRAEARGGRDGVAFVVEDTGIGMSEEGRRRLFGEFVQVDDSSARKYEGTGLGLALSRRFAVMLGGDIGVESVEGEGSTFTLWLPRTAPEPAADSGGDAAAS